MARKIWSAAKRISLGLVLTLVYLFTWVKADELYPVNTALWKGYLLTYIFMAAILFGFTTLASEKSEKLLFKISFVKALPIFLISALLTGIALFFFGYLVKGSSLPSIGTAISTLSMGAIIFHAGFVSSIEEKFRAFIEQQLRARGISKPLAVFIAVSVFAIFHWQMGGNILLLFIYIPLGLLFTYIRDRFSPKSDMANMGAHFSWNMFILGFIRA